MIRSFLILLACLLGFGLAASCAAAKGESTSGDCAVGSEKCQCTQGGSCDPGLQCLSGICVDPSSSSGTAGSGGGNGGSGGFTSSSGTGGSQNCQQGCKKIDVLFALDHSGSMQEEIAALSASQAFTQVVGALSAINCGDIEMRIGLTDDNTPSFITPGGWTGGTPWFDSASMTPAQIATAFNGAASALMGGPTTPTGCEHVLTNATNLLKSDSTGFVRNDALLVLVLISDVDDYGAYDQGIVDCGILGQIPGCQTPPPPMNTLHGDLLALKNGDDKGLAAIVVAGDPNVTAGVNICNQPASCCGPMDCDGAFHADRLWAYAGLQAGSNGYVADICGGAASVPSAVEDAMNNNIDLACQGFEPPR